MKKGILFFLITANLTFGQTSNNSLKIISEFSSVNVEMRNILEFENIDYYKIKFIGNKLKNKSYQLSVKEVWDGKIVSDSVLINSKDLPFKQHQAINDSILDLTVISKLTDDKKLKMWFKFKQFSISREFKALDSDDYSLRNIAEESNMTIGYNKKFYLLTYILPYKRQDGSKSWCDVGVDGMDIENWGEKFGIKHYLIFEMKFED